jgi:predicted outer membrane repeat protein
LIERDGAWEIHSPHPTQYYSARRQQYVFLRRKKMKRQSILVLAIAVFLLEMAVPTAARIIYVDANTPDNNDGSSWAKAYNYLQDALADANSDPNVDEIRVAQGIYTPDSNSGDPNGSGDQSATFQLISGITLMGGYAGIGEPDPNVRDVELYQTILSGDIGTPGSGGDNSYHVVTGSGTDANAILDGFTITAGNANSSDPYNRGGGMYNDAGSPTVLHCTFTSNTAFIHGGGMYNSGSSPTVKDCTFTSNTTVLMDGGAMCNVAGSNPTVTNCTFNSNSAGVNGGGINGAANVTHCTFSGNSAYRYGGGIYGAVNVTNCMFSGNGAEAGGGIHGAANVTNCTFSGNGADRGGGMVNSESSFTVTNCTFSGNSAEGYGPLDGAGGGMYNYGSPTVVNCSFSQNTADTNGGGMYNYGSSPTVTNCILWADEPDEVYNSSSSPTVTYSDIQGGWPEPNNTNIDADPCFADPCNDDYHLKSQAGRWDPNSQSWVQDANTSPCIDAGDPSSSIGWEPYPNGGRINMGAYGGTEEASKSYFGVPVCQEPIAGDINGDCKVNFFDLAIMGLHWLEDNTE